MNNKTVNGKKRYPAIYLLGDILAACLSMYLAVWLRFEGHINLSYSTYIFEHMILASLSVVLAGAALGTYKGMWEYFSLADLYRQMWCAGASGAVLILFKYSLKYSGSLYELVQSILPTFYISGSILVIYTLFVFVLTVAIRLVRRTCLAVMHNLPNNKKSTNRTIIIGAGTTGAMFIRRLIETDLESDIEPVVAVDYDESKLGMRISGILVGGHVADIPTLAKKYRATDAVLAIPSIGSIETKEIYDICDSVGVRLRVFRDTVDVESFLSGTKAALKEVSIEDLLFRESVKPDMTKVFELLNGKTVLVTGGAGSIGSEICRQVLEHGCRKLVIFDIHENGLFEINEELKDKFDNSRYCLALGSVRDKMRLSDVFEAHRPDIVLHAAAHKHVPMMEINPIEAVKNNVIGTKNVLDCCVEYGCARFTLISTDKAVRSTNIMGATKRMAELLVQMMNGKGGCEMSAVRFGNVLGSNGSVIPIFKRQIAAGGPVTVTHKDIVRFFMTISEAVSLVLSAGTIANGGEIFVLDMGKPVKVYDLARDLIRLSGLEPGKDIKIEVTGLRPGEKLYEELLQENEAIDSTTHEKIFVISRKSTVDTEFVSQSYDSLVRAVQEGEGEQQVRKMVFNITESVNAVK